MSVWWLKCLPVQLPPKIVISQITCSYQHLLILCYCYSHLKLPTSIINEPIFQITSLLSFLLEAKSCLSWNNPQNKFSFSDSAPLASSWLPSYWCSASLGKILDVPMIFMDGRRKLPGVIVFLEVSKVSQN